MSGEPTQLVLDLPHRAALEAEDFVVSSANSAAVELIDAWPEWPHWAAVVCGPAGCGKSHLANVWRLRSHAEIIPAAAVGDSAVERLKSCGALVIEDLERGIGDEKALFHLLNVARQDRTSLLLTTSTPPGNLSISLPDLRSRLRALPLVQVGAPDEALLRVMLVKLFADRQLTVDPHVISFIAVRMERSMAAAAQIVEKLDKLGLAMHRKVTRPLAQKALDTIANGNDFSL